MDEEGVDEGGMDEEGEEEGGGGKEKASVATRTRLPRSCHPRAVLASISCANKCLEETGRLGRRD